jgi:mono/diheme cytochrome c family protein
LTASQLLRQLVALALIVLIWGGGLFLFLSATSSSGASSVVEVVATATPVPAPTATSTPAVTRTSQPVATATSAATAEPTATTSPTDEPTDVPATDVPPADEDVAVSFQRDVLPIFIQICVKCHGGEEIKEGLSLKSFAEVMQGSDNGGVIVPGDPANSLLVRQVESGEMPKRGPKLLPRQIQAIVAWIAAGAPDN